MPVNHTNPFGKGRAILMNLSPSGITPIEPKAPNLLQSEVSL
jgi:hypothetical protein